MSSEAVKSDSARSAAQADESVLAARPFWLSVLRWLAWLAMLALVLAFAAKGGGGAFIYQNF